MAKYKIHMLDGTKFEVECDYISLLPDGRVYECITASNGTLDVRAVFDQRSVMGWVKETG